MSSERRPTDPPTDPFGVPTATRVASGRAAASLESARRRLGGRASSASTRAPGSLVEATLRDGSQHAGVVLWASENHCDTWFDDGIARRTPAGAVRSRGGPMPEPLVGVAADVLVFATLGEGEPVRLERAVGVVEGRIAEKCRYGAIVVTGDGKVIAVGFRKLWPVVVHAVA